MKTKAFATLIIALVASVYLFNNRISEAERSSKEYFFDRGGKPISLMAANIISVFEKQNIFLNMPFIRQENRLTCEIAALRMSLAYLGHEISEAELVENISFSTREPRGLDNVWGDPNIGFVGDVNGSIYFGTGYGVYANPIAKLAGKYASSSVIKKADLNLVFEEVSQGHPVIVWGMISNSNPIHWTTEDGKTVVAYPGEHARVVMGYTGNIKNPDKIILMDPLYGRVSMDASKFIADWKLQENRAVVVYNPLNSLDIR